MKYYKRNFFRVSFFFSSIAKERERNHIVIFYHVLDLYRVRQILLDVCCRGSQRNLVLEITSRNDNNVFSQVSCKKK